jgi:hypothetical protein
MQAQRFSNARDLWANDSRNAPWKCTYAADEAFSIFVERSLASGRGRNLNRPHVIIDEPCGSNAILPKNQKREMPADATRMMSLFMSGPPTGYRKHGIKGENALCFLTYY